MAAPVACGAPGKPCARKHLLLGAPIGLRRRRGRAALGLLLLLLLLLRLLGGLLLRRLQSDRGLSKPQPSSDDIYLALILWFALWFALRFALWFALWFALCTEIFVKFALNKKHETAQTKLTGIQSCSMRGH